MNLPFPLKSLTKVIYSLFPLPSFIEQDLTYVSFKRSVTPPLTSRGAEWGRLKSHALWSSQNDEGWGGFLKPPVLCISFFKLLGGFFQGFFFFFFFFFFSF